MATANCPSCGRQLEVEDTYRDWTVRCPHCGHEFVPSQSAARTRTEEREYRRDDDEEEDEDEYEQDDYAYGYERMDRHYARQLASGPGLWLEILGWGSAVLTAIACGLMVLAAVMEQNNNRRGGGEGVFIFMAVCMAVISLPFSVVIGMGGRHLRNLSSRGWALTAAILCIVLFWAFGICGVIHLGIGIWAIVVLEKPAVRRAFGLRTGSGERRRRRRRDDWYD